jgi:hypothetical protein
VPSIILDFDPPQTEAPALPEDTSALVYFLSWAFSTRYGANHELSVAALILRGEFNIDLVPLLTFADRNVEDPADADAMERSWQDAAPLAECCEAVVRALGSDEKRLTALQEEYPHLRGHIASLGEAARWAAARGSRVRVTYTLDG